MATYPIKMLRDEDRQPFLPFTNAAAIVDSNNVTLQKLMDEGKYKIQNNVTTSSAGKGVLDAYQGKVLNDKFNNYVPLSQKGVANGVATLDADAKVPSAQLPSYVDDVIEGYIRSGATALSSAWLSLTDGGAALTPEKGKIYLIMTAGSYQNKQYRWGGSTYVLCNPSDVNSVNGMTGVVTLKKLTIQKNGAQVGDTFNGSADKTINITVPTKTSDITNDSGFITASADITGNAATATNATNALYATNDANGDKIDTTYVKKAGDTMSGNLTTPILITTSQMTVASGKVSGLTGGTSRLYSNGLAISNPTTPNDLGWIRVLGTGENDTILEIATGDDGGGTNGATTREEIVVRQYATDNSISREIKLFDKNGNSSFPGIVSASSFTGPLTGNVNGYNIEGPVYGIKTFTKQLTVGTEWMDTGISYTDLDSGSYIIQLVGPGSAGSNLYSETWTGVMTWYAGNTNSHNAEEILLHNAGHADNSNELYLRTIRTGGNTINMRLQIAAKVGITQEHSYTFKFRRMI